MQNNYYKKTFPNGLRYIYAPLPQSPSTTIMILVAAGSEYETKDINGISHFLEHLSFKGTKKRPEAAMISEELDQIGAEHNAFTSNELTGYYAKAANRHFGKILDVVSDLYLNQIIDQKEMDKERGVIIEETNMYEDLPTARVAKNFDAMLYGDQPAGWTVLGPKEVIQKMTREDVLNYRAKHYVAQKTVVVVSGGIEKNPEEEVWEYFKDMPKSEAIKKELTTESQTQPEINIENREGDQMHIILGMRAFDMFDERRYTLSVLKTVIGAGMSSRLFKKIRNELGAAYYVRAGVELDLDHGIFAISAGLDKNRLPELTEALIVELKRIRDELVPEEELNKAKEFIAGNMALSLETSDNVAGFYGDDEVMTGRIETMEEVLEKIRKVSAEDIQMVARDIIKDERLNMAVVGPTDKDLYGKIKGILRVD